VTADDPRAAGAIIALVIFLLVTLFWRAGMLQVPEFHVYDRFIQWRASPLPGESRVVVIEITEPDIQRLENYPISDGKLAELLRKLLALQPAAVAIDLFRDKAMPGVEPRGAEELWAVLTGHPNVIGIKRIGFGGHLAISAPPALRDIPEQIGCNDFSVDERIDGGARRALLLMDDRGTIHYSVSLLTSLLYLQMRGVSLEQDPAQPEALTLGQAHLRPLRSDEGAYIGADVRGYQMLLDFRKHRGTEDRTISAELVFPSYTLYDALDGKIPAEQIAGKVVLIGTTASSMKDFLSTPLGERYPGVMLHAQVVDQLLRSALEGARPTRSWPELGEAAWILAWTIAGVTLGLALRAPLGLFVSGVVALGMLLGVAWLAFRGGFWLLTAAPASGFALAAALSVAYVSQREWHQRMLLMQLFGRHVAPEIAQAVWEHRSDFYAGVGLRPQKLTATVLFTDLRGFSATSESMEPEGLMTWLNQYMNAMTELVAQHGGVLNKFLGDGLMALFGVPLSRSSYAEIQQDAANAVRCALAMGRRLEQLNHEWAASGQPASAMRIGIHTGPLVAGSLGGVERLEYTVIGDTVNTASRLESTRDENEAAETLCRILVSGSTHDLLDGQFEARPVGSVALRGKKEKTIVISFSITPREVRNVPLEDAPHAMALSLAAGRLHAARRAGAKTSAARPCLDRLRSRRSAHSSHSSHSHRSAARAQPPRSAKPQVAKPRCPRLASGCRHPRRWRCGLFPLCAGARDDRHHQARAAFALLVPNQTSSAPLRVRPAAAW
jgi:adenylate cyclase